MTAISADRVDDGSAIGGVGGGGGALPLVIDISDGRFDHRCVGGGHEVFQDALLAALDAFSSTNTIRCARV